MATKSGGALLTALGDAILAICASADVTNDALRTDEQPQTQPQPATQPARLRAETEQRNDATNLMRGVTNVRTRDCGRGCDVVGACHTLFHDGTHLLRHGHAASAAHGYERRKPWTARRFRFN
jgi:hypothetical protein